MEGTKIFTIDIKKWTKSKLIPVSYMPRRFFCSFKTWEGEFSVSDSELRYGYQEIVYAHPKNFCVYF